MQREILFVLIILAPLYIATPLVVLCLKQKVPIRLVPGLIAALGVYALFGLFPPFSIGATYWHIGFITMISVGSYAAVWQAHRLWVRVFCTAGIMICGIIAGCLLYGLSDGYRDNTRDTSYMYRDKVATNLQDLLLATAAERTFPAGYITENSPVLTPLSPSEKAAFEVDMRKWGYSWKIVSRWHTPLTGLYRVDKAPMHLWYPGGKIKDTMDKIEWRY